MKRFTHSFSARPLRQLAVALAAAIPVMCSAAASYSMLDLGAGVSASDLNASGQVVGIVHGGTQDSYFVTGANGVGRFDLGALAPSAINDQGVVVGGVQNGSYSTAAIYRPGSGVSLLGQPGWATSWAKDVSATGQVVGYYSKDIGGGALGPVTGFLTAANGGAVSDWGGTPEAINASGQVVGSVSGSRHAVLSGPNGVGLTDLGALSSPYLSNPASHASAVSGLGRVAGYSDYATYNYPYSTSTYTVSRAYVTGPGGQGMKDLGVLPTPAGSMGASFYADGVNDAGQVVGEYSYFTSNWTSITHAFITNADGVGMVDLNSVLTLSGGDYFTMARSINESGQFLASTFLGHTYLVSPTAVPEVDSRLMFGLGLFGVVSVAARRRGSRSQG